MIKDEESFWSLRFCLRRGETFGVISRSETRMSIRLMVTKARPARGRWQNGRQRDTNVT